MNQEKDGSLVCSACEIGLSSLEVDTVTTISIEVDDTAARTFFSAPKEEREKLQLLLDLRLRELTSTEQKSLGQILDEIGFHAKAQGLDESLLNSMLNEE